jgi:hypothetical protein
VDSFSCMTADLNYLPGIGPSENGIQLLLVEHQETHIELLKQMQVYLRATNARMT